MLGIKQAKMLLSQLGMSEQDTEKFETLIAPHIDFHKYLMEKLDISSEETEKLTEAFSREYLVKKIGVLQQEGVNVQELSEADYFGMAGEAMKTFAIQHEYDSFKAEILEKNIIDVAALLVNITRDLAEKGLLK